jgi:hypothetical protein
MATDSTEKKTKPKRINWWKRFVLWWQTHPVFGPVAVGFAILAAVLIAYRNVDEAREILCNRFHILCSSTNNPVAPTNNPVVVRYEASKDVPAVQSSGNWINFDHGLESQPTNLVVVRDRWFFIAPKDGAYSVTTQVTIEVDGNTVEMANAGEHGYRAYLYADVDGQTNLLNARTAEFRIAETTRPIREQSTIDLLKGQHLAIRLDLNLPRANSRATIKAGPHLKGTFIEIRAR